MRSLGISFLIPTKEIKYILVNSFLKYIPFEKHKWNWHSQKLGTKEKDKLLQSGHGFVNSTKWLGSSEITYTLSRRLHIHLNYTKPHDSSFFTYFFHVYIFGVILGKEERGAALRKGEILFFSLLSMSSSKPRMNLCFCKYYLLMSSFILKGFAVARWISWWHTFWKTLAMLAHHTESGVTYFSQNKQTWIESSHCK